APWHRLVLFCDRTARAQIYTLSLHDALPILLAMKTGLMKQIGELERVLREFAHRSQSCRQLMLIPDVGVRIWVTFAAAIDDEARSEEHTSELQSRENLVCRLLLEKKKDLNVH